MASDSKHEIADGTLVVRSTRRGDTHCISLCGELDLANCRTAEAELHEAMENETEVVIDMRELEFIDSTGIALLVAALRHCSETTQLRFIPSESPTVARVLELTGIDQRLPLAEPS
jgi:anti-sigma B factor antagonist